MRDRKIIIDLLVPNIGKKYNIFIPQNKTVGEVISILNNAINEMTGFFPVDNSLILFNVEKSQIYDFNSKISELDINNGTLLALI